MRQPARKLAPRQQVTQVEDPEFGTLLELPVIDIEGDPDANVLPYSEEEARDIPMRGHNPNRRRRPVTELEPIDIQGSRSADVAPFDMESLPKFADEPAFVPGAQEPARRADGVSTMLPDWVPSWATEVIGQPVRTGMGGSTEWEFAPLIAELVADEEGRMPDSMVGIGTSLMADPVNAANTLTMFMNPFTAPLINQRAFSGAAPTREARSLSPEAAALGFADAGAVPLNAAARLMGEDNFFGMFDDGTGVEGADWEREIRTSQRQNPGSFAVGELANMAAQMPIPSAAAGRGASTAARVGYAALEGAAYGGAEGMARSNAPTFMGQLQDSAIGAVGGAVLGGVPGALSARMERRAAIPVDDIEVDGLLDRAAWHHLSQAGADQSQARQRMMTTGDSEAEMTRDARRLVEQMRARDVLPAPGSYFGRSQEAIQNDTARIGREGLARIRDQVRPAMEAEAISTQPIVDAVNAQIERLSRDPTQAGVVARLRTWRDGYGAQDTVTWQQYQEWKDTLGVLSNYTPDEQTPRGITYGAVTEAMQDAVDQTRPDLGPTYQRAREDARLGYVVGENAASDARREGRVRVVSPTDYMAGLGGGVAGAVAMFSDAVQGAGSGGLGAVAVAGGGLLANRAFRAREHAMQAGRLERAAMALRTRPQRFGRQAAMLQAALKRGPQAFAAALYIAQQNDEAVRAAMAEEEDVAGMRERGTEAVPTMDAAIEEDINSIPTMDDL